MFENIKRIRLEKGISQRELASKADVSSPYIFDLENGRRGARPETLEKIASALGVKVEELYAKTE